MAHGGPTEVDGTMGNPGVPASGHSIEPGDARWSPSAAEIEGKMRGGGRQAPLRRHVGEGTTCIVVEN